MEFDETFAGHPTRQVAGECAVIRCFIMSVKASTIIYGRVGFFLTSKEKMDPDLRNR